MISQTANKDLMAQARQTLAGKWITVAIATLALSLVILVVSFVTKRIPLAGFIIPLVIAGPLTLGFYAYMLAVSRGGSPELPVVFSGFSNFVKAMCLYILMYLIVLVGFILLIVPGVIAAIALIMSWFIMIDNPQMGVVDVMTASYDMTRGNKMKLFCLLCRFIGWAILCVFTLGIGYLFLMPYIQVTLAKFYEEIKGIPEAAQSHAS